MNRPIVFFDWDGTLADSMDLCLAEVSMALERLGLPPRPDDLIRKVNGPTNEESVAILGLDPADGEAYLRMRRVIEREIVPEKQKLFPGIPAMLDRVRAYADLAVVSNGQPEYVGFSAESTGIADRFVRVQPRVEGRTKAETLGAMLAELAPPFAVMAGDRAGDFEAGRANGLVTVAAAFGYGNDAEYALADRRADTVEELGDVLVALVTGREGTPC